MDDLSVAAVDRPGVQSPLASGSGAGENLGPGPAAASCSA